ncbi:glyoxysomal processing protease, glyoxysomal-like isoform X2 [Phragmites australis]|uniref:glyoxysomal processing protease, glyoxysomal-like isoform X2 n=1 Tax=Phragmites australis TaxID=29695 RepID=UPI002D782542|nr:glyoxysomal processing protease, glyoxysomal-like isoform X2 [Phragmites australis]
MRRHAFHLQQSGSTSLSASAVLLPRDSLADPPPLLDRICAAHGHVAGDVALTAASLVESFLVAEQRDRPDQELHPRLVPEARLDVLVEVVKIPSTHHSHLAGTVEAEADNVDMPVMLQTTAGVHPGASGGALVNSFG